MELRREGSRFCSEFYDAKWLCINVKQSKRHFHESEWITWEYESELKFRKRLWSLHDWGHYEIKERWRLRVSLSIRLLLKAVILIHLLILNIQISLAKFMGFSKCNFPSIFHFFEDHDGILSSSRTRVK